MKNKIVALMLAGCMALSITACGGGKETPKNNESKTENVEKEPEVEVTYQSILEEYTKKIADATPKLVEEYNKESAKISNDLNALAKLSNDKVGELAKISNDGISEMAKLMQKSGDKYSVYEEWSLKLTDVYTEYAKQITDSYTNSASGMSTEDLMNSLESIGQ